MKILVTAGNTLVLIDQVRAITNIFTGRTGATIALEAHDRGHSVTLLTSHPESVLTEGSRLPPEEHWRLCRYTTFEDLQTLMEKEITQGNYEAIVHCAAVSDYRAAGIYAPVAGTTFNEATGQWQASATPTLLDRMSGKVKSDEPELWLRLVRAPKLIDRIRSDWNFQGLLVKFKLEVGLNDQQLLEIAERSRVQSQANLMVANTLEGARSYAFVGPMTADGQYERIGRAELAPCLLNAMEARTRR